MAKEKEIEAEKSAEKPLALVLNECSEELGTGSISQNTVARIVAKAAKEIEGVARFAPKGAGDFLNFITGKATDSSLAIEFADGKINLNLALNFYYGAQIPRVVKQVRANVVSKLTELTGAEIGKINILVKDLVDPEAVEEAEQDAEVIPEEK